MSDTSIAGILDAYQAAHQRGAVSMVLAQFGTYLNSEGRAPCPIHHGTEPNLAVGINDAGMEIATCFSVCGLSWGPVELQELLSELNGQESLYHVADLMGDGSAAPYLPPHRDPNQRLSNRLKIDYTAPQGLMLERFFEGDEGDTEDLAQWVRDEFGVRGTSELIVVPHFRASLQGDPSWEDVTGAKRREPKTAAIPYNTNKLTVGDLLSTTWTNKAYAGSKLGDLYGTWRVTGEEGAVILCEGESDSWMLSYWLRDDPRFLILALASGAGHKPTTEIMESIRHIQLITAFDNDNAGNRATELWQEACFSTAFQLDIAPGQDVRSTGKQETLRLLDKALEDMEENEARRIERDNARAKRANR